MPDPKAIDFDRVRNLFGGFLTQPQVDGINTVLDAWERFGDGDAQHLAYLLATQKHETAHTMQPIYERGAKAYFNKYEPGTKIGANLGNTLKGDGYKFRGRGYVQLTGRSNYIKAGKKLGIDLVGSPDLALQPDIAARILIRGCVEGWFTGKKLGDYATFRDMRRVVNGTDKADLIAGYADVFLKALASKPIPAEPFREPDPEDAIAPPTPRRTDAIGSLIRAIIQIIASLFGRKKS